MSRCRSVVVSLAMVAAVAGLFLPTSSLAVTPAADAPRTVTLRVGGQAIVVEIADNERKRDRGLMGRFTLPENRGMLFVFSRPQVLAFWMKNTPIPLSIAFISKQGRILNVEEMAPSTETVHTSRGDGMYALEMRRGWFGDHGIAPGAKVGGLERLKPAVD